MFCRSKKIGFTQNFKRDWHNDGKGEGFGYIENQSQPCPLPTRNATIALHASGQCFTTANQEGGASSVRPMKHRRRGAFETKPATGEDGIRSVNKESQLGPGRNTRAHDEQIHREIRRCFSLDGIENGTTFG